MMNASDPSAAPRARPWATGMTALAALTMAMGTIACEDDVVLFSTLRCLCEGNFQRPGSQQCASQNPDGIVLIEGLQCDAASATEAGGTTCFFEVVSSDPSILQVDRPFIRQAVVGQVVSNENKYPLMTRARVGQATLSVFRCAPGTGVTDDRCNQREASEAWGPETFRVEATCDR